MNLFFAFAPALLLACTALAESAAAPTSLERGGASEFEVELPAELRLVAGRGQLSPVAHARVAIAVPSDFDPARDWPVLVINFTSGPQRYPSRGLAAAYRDTALGAGWIVLAADPVEEVAVEKDDVALRYALDLAALAVLKLQWSGAANAPLAFGGFSGGAKYSGWLAAAFASRGRTIAGLYLAGINEDTVTPAARDFNVLSESYRRIPIFLQSGESDQVATMADHRHVYDDLKRTGFRNVRIEHFSGGHTVYAPPLATALDWFRQTLPR